MQHWVPLTGQCMKLKEGAEIDISDFSQAELELPAKESDDQPALGL